MVIYIHGFAGSGEGNKARLFREYFKGIGQPFIAPSLSYIPELAIKTLEELIESYDGEVKLIGSSLGGYYSLYLAQKYNIKAVLINPAIYPYIRLAEMIGNAENFYDQSYFEWNQHHIEMLKKYKIKLPTKENFLLLVQKGDEVLDYKEALNYLSNVKSVIEEHGSHSYDGIENHFSLIASFLADI